MHFYRTQSQQVQTLLFVHMDSLWTFGLMDLFPGLGKRNAILPTLQPIV